jgi:hypothetical protein
MIIGVCNCKELEHQLHDYDPDLATLPCPRCNSMIIWRY